MTHEQSEGQPSGFDTAEQIQDAPKGKPVGSPEVSFDGAVRADEAVDQSTAPTLEASEPDAPIQPTAA